MADMAERYPELFNIIPGAYTNVIVESFTKEKEGFSAEIRLPISRKEDALNWVAMLEERSLTTFRVDRTYPENTKKLVFKVCQMHIRYYRYLFNYSIS